MEILTENDLVHILNFLSLQDLKNVRRINSIWDATAKLLLRKKSRVVLKFYNDPLGEAIKELGKFVQEMVNFDHFDNMQMLIFSGKQSSNINFYNETIGTICTKVLKPTLKHFKLYMELDSAPELENFEAILLHFGPNLEELELFIWGPLVNENLNIPEGLRLPKLLKFTDDFSYYEDDSFYRKIFKIAPNITQIVGRPSRFEFMQISPKNLPNLNSISVKIHKQRELDSFTILDRRFKSITLKFGHRIKKYLDVYPLLEKQRLNLEQFQLNDVIMVQNFEFPICPKLRVLGLLFATTDPKETVPFEVAEIIDFSKVLPSLASLTVAYAEDYYTTPASGCLEKCLDSVLKEEEAANGAICKSLQVLELPQNCRGHKCKEQGFDSKYLWLPNLFPNAEIWFLGLKNKRVNKLNM